MPQAGKRLAAFSRSFTQKPKGPVSAVDRLPDELREAVDGYYAQCVKLDRRPDHAMLSGFLKAEGHIVSRTKLGNYYRTRYAA